MIPNLSGKSTAPVRSMLMLLAVLALLVTPGLALAQTSTPSTGDNIPVTIPPMGPLAPTAAPEAVYDPLAELTALSPDASVWISGFCINNEICKTGDFNGDGRDDVVRFVRSTVLGVGQGDVFVALSNGAGFGQQMLWHDAFCLDQEECRVADVNNDGLDDILSFVRGSTGNVWVATSNGNGFNASGIWRSGFCVLDELCETGDFNGDGRDDIVSFARGASKVWIALSNGAVFGPASIWNPGFLFCAAGEICTTGDFNGDGLDDVIAFARPYGAVWVATSYGAGLNKSSLWNQTLFCYGQEECRVGDFNGDNKDDIVAFLRATQAQPKRGDVYVGLSTGTSFQTGQLWNNYFCDLAEVCDVGDFNKDRRADLIAFTRGAVGNVWVELSPGPPPPASWLIMTLINRRMPQ